MTATFKSIDTATHARLVADIRRQGFACIPDYLNAEHLARLRSELSTQAVQHHGNYFAYHGGSTVERSLLGLLAESTEFRSLLDAVHQLSCTRPAHDPVIRQVLRCVQGQTGRRESNAFHYDATLVTALVPIEIPQDAEQCGDLLMFPNIRPVRANVLFNLLEKALLQNRLSRALLVFAIRHSWARPLRLILQPGNLYLFWGYRTLHANEPCSPTHRRATALFHYGDPHAGSLLTRLTLKLTERRARRRSRPPLGSL
ncbi:phytanoyl-CoA dioxygenase family protein [Halopseudomonas bauzanensis]|uniref:2OG-Fe(II) oxygenase n=1 Tax=Halopseudomonas bauzanensis TaxID=653930 RepID=A0A031MJN2_9GAMM|nr:hypothetical protein [Halopseudomonas bauzanensis]EZQ19623.1 hypothetical protein CF98_04115 [Halopseudomonas bauzanensis]SER40389.1 hypothetical protein SAMN05216589_0457 [Halopseudomonas bauzanensis]SFL77756.1 hypothetical protein SAMN04487855_1167 [Halopseudomonas bauzanensis]